VEPGRPGAIDRGGSAERRRPAAPTATARWAAAISHGPARASGDERRHL